MNFDCTFARIQLDERDGHIHAYSDDVPGLNICGTDKEAVLRDVIRGIEFLYREVRGMKVSVQWVQHDNPLLPPARAGSFKDVSLQIQQ